MARLGFIGLGVMGGRIVKRLLDAGHTVVGYNRTKSKAQWLLDDGMQWGETPRSVAEMSDVIFSMVTNTSAVQEVFNGHNGIQAGLEPGKIYIDMSTVNPAITREVAHQVEAKGAYMLDAPISGNVATLDQGSSSIMVGGNQEIFEQIKPILFAIGSKVDYVGANGQATLMKIAINLSLQVQFLAFSEGLLLAEKGGIPRKTAIETMLHSAIISPSLRHRIPFILEMPEEPWFDVNMMQKDMLLALDMGRQLDVPLPMVALSNQFLTSARAMGLASKDFAIVFEVMARLCGLDDG